MTEVCGSTDTTTGQPCQFPSSENCPHHGQTSDDLTDKQRRFIEEYTVDFNATQAAIRAGYSEKTAAQQGHQLLNKTSVSEAIEERLEQLAMSADEALKRLADWGRGDLTPFLRETEDGDVVIDLSTEEARRNMHLIRKIKFDERRVDDERTELRQRIELHDAKDAVKQIAKAHGLFVDKTVVSGPGGGPVQQQLEVVPTDDLDPDEWEERYGAGGENET